MTSQLFWFGKPAGHGESLWIQLVDPVPNEPPRGREVRRRIGGSARVVAVPLDVAVTVHQTHRAAGVLNYSPIQVEAATAIIDRTAASPDAGPVS